MSASGVRHLRCDAQLQDLFIFNFFLLSFFPFVSVATLWVGNIQEQNDAVVPERIHRPYRDLYLTLEHLAMRV